MTINFRAGASVVNAAAGTSVVVARPVGTVNGDVLLAFISATGTPSITTPAGWTLIGTRDASTNVRVAAYRKVAASEPASWTWTLGASQRNGGWVGAYTNVDTALPVVASGSVADTTAGTSWSTATVAASPDAPLTVSMVATVRTASGAATTFTSPDTERADQSTNAGSGTDIAFAVADGDFVNGDSTHSNIFTSNQSCTAGALWDISLSPAFTGYDGGKVAVIVEAAFGADPAGDPDLWDWTDISADVLAGGVTITKGLQPETQAPLAQPTNVSFALRNFVDDRGDYTPDNPLSQYFPNIVADTPIRVSVPYGYAPPTERATVFVESWTPDWDASTRRAIVQVQAYGRLQQIQTAAAPVESVLRRTLSGVLPGSTSRAHAYWPAEDQGDGRRIASAFAQSPADATLGVNFASASDCPGSAPLPTLDAGAFIHALVPAYATTTQWVALAVVKMPSTSPASTTRVLQATGTGSAPLWWLELAPGSPDTLRMRAYTDADSSILDDPVNIVEADVLGQWVLVYIAVTQNGSNIDYSGGYRTSDGGAGNTGTLNSRTIGRIVRVTGLADASSAGMGIGHLAAVVDPAYNHSTALSFLAMAALDGRAGDQPYVRFSDLCEIAGVPYDVHLTAGPPSLTMGPLLPTTLPAALEEAAATDQGLIHDGGPGGALVMVTRSSRYNSPVRSTQDVNQRELAQPFLPQYTNRNRVSDSIVSRSGGSSARYVDSTVRGGQQASVTFSLDDDHFLEQIAGYRSRLSTTPGMRYPQLQLNLRRKPALVEQWLRCRIGSRMQVVNLWRTHGPNDVDQFIDGYVERLARDRWEITQHCSPARPFDVPVLESGTVSQFRADCEATTLLTAAGAADTALVVTSAAALVTTNPADYPVDIDVGGEQMTATATASVVTDAFGGSSVAGWTPADTGQAWTHPFGAASDYTEGGGDGDMVLAAADSFRGAVLDAGSPYVDWTLDLALSVSSASTASITLWVCAGWADTSNYNTARLTLSTGGVMSLGLLRRNAGTLTTIANPVTGTSNTANDRWRVTMRGYPGYLVASMRNVTTGGATTSVIGAAEGLLATGTGVAILGRRELGNTAAVTIAVDNVTVTNPQVISVTRGQFARAHTAGTSVRLWRGRGVAL